MKNPENEKKMKENTTRVILNVPNELDEQFKDLATKRGITKSSMIIYAMSWFLDYNRSLDIMPKLIDVIKANSQDLNTNFEEKK